ncbi:HK97 family phage prohead protease [bacterium]|nr:HK97 family phage prohead protease [bacterium]
METPITHQLERDQENYEIRVANASVDDSNTIFGMIPYNTLSQDLGGFRERILPSAFRMTLDSGSEVWSMFQHDHNKVMARRSTETLKLTERDDGLQIEISPSNTTWSNDALEVIRHGDSDGFSFGFWIPENGDRWIKDGDQIIRDLISVELGEVSVVFNPAYRDQAQISVRAMEKVREFQPVPVSVLEKRLRLKTLQTCFHSFNFEAN